MIEDTKNQVEATYTVENGNQYDAKVCDGEFGKFSKCWIYYRSSMDTLTL